MLSPCTLAGVRAVTLGLLTPPVPVVAPQVMVARAPEAVMQLFAWTQAGDLVSRVDVDEGLENAPRALRRLFTGDNFGKQLLKIAG